MFRFVLAFFALFAFAAAQQYYAQASAYPYLTGAYAPSNLAGGVPAVVEPVVPAYSGYGYYPSVYGRK